MSIPLQNYTGSGITIVAADASAATVAGEPDRPATWGNLCVLRSGDILALTTWRGGIWYRLLSEQALGAKQ